VLTSPAAHLIGSLVTDTGAVDAETAIVTRVITESGVTVLTVGTPEALLTNALANGAVTVTATALSTARRCTTKLTAVSTGVTGAMLSGMLLAEDIFNLSGIIALAGAIDADTVTITLVGALLGLATSTSVRGLAEALAVAAHTLTTAVVGTSVSAAIRTSVGRVAVTNTVETDTMIVAIAGAEESRAVETNGERLTLTALRSTHTVAAAFIGALAEVDTAIVAGPRIVTNAEACVGVAGTVIVTAVRANANAAVSTGEARVADALLGGLVTGTVLAGRADILLTVSARVALVALTFETRASEVADLDSGNTLTVATAAVALILTAVCATGAVKTRALGFVSGRRMRAEARERAVIGARRERAV